MARVGLFRDLAPALNDRLAREVRDVSIRKRRTLFRKGDPCDGFYAVVFGRIKLCLFASDGRERPLQIAQADDTFGDATMFQGLDHYVTAIAVEDSRLLFAPRAAILRLVAEEPDFSLRIMANLSGRLHRMVEDIEAFSIEPPGSRLVCYLLRLASNARGDRVCVTLDVNKSLIAARLSMTPETLSRHLRAMAEQDLLQVEGQRVAIGSLRALTNYVG